MTGTVYLVGAGPGDPELLTVKAWHLLTTAPVVFHDRLVSDAILHLAPPGARLIDVGKQPGGAATSQHTINRMLLDAARRHDSVVRLKGGDPLIFGRGAEEADHLRAHGIEVDIVPGITSALGVPTSAGVPVTRRGVAGGFAVVTGQRAEGDTDWSRYAAIDTLIVLMGVRNRTDIAAALIAAGRSGHEPTLFIERGTTATERSLPATLGQVADGTTVISPPAVWIIGAVTEAAQVVVPSHKHQPGSLPCRDNDSDDPGPLFATVTPAGRRAPALLGNSTGCPAGLFCAWTGELDIGVSDGEDRRAGRLEGAGDGWGL